MFGSGILKGLGVTLKRTVGTFTDDFSRVPSRYTDAIETSQGKILRQPTDSKGIFTIQYPEEKRELPENFRYIPMLIYEEDSGRIAARLAASAPRCARPSASGSSATRMRMASPSPARPSSIIDASICMSCGFCAEYCPFDAIKMNHDYELATYDRFPGLVYNKEELSVPTSYYAALYPSAWAMEEAHSGRKRGQESGSRPRERPANRPKRRAQKASTQSRSQPGPSRRGSATRSGARARAKPAGGHSSPIPAGYTGALIDIQTCRCLPSPPKEPAPAACPGRGSWNCARSNCCQLS